MDLVADLGLDAGTTAVVGAGGKKTTLYTVANRLDRAVVTSTVRIPHFDEHVATLIETDDPVGALETVSAWPVGLVAGHEDARYIGYDPAALDDLADRTDAQAILVKADGARNREFKAPGEDEPKIPAVADRTLVIASTHVVGKPLTEEYVHRIERVEALTGRKRGETIRAEDVATVLASTDGGRKNVPAGTELVPVLNKVDDAEDEAVAREIAAQILETSPIERVALTRLIDPDRQLVDVVEQ